MARILILDADSAVAGILKKLLGERRHRVDLASGVAQPEETAICAETDLVLIGHRSWERHCWDSFNRWKQSAVDTPMLLYFLDHCRPESYGWLLQAVGMALTERGRMCDPAQSRCADSPCEDQGGAVMPGQAKTRAQARFAGKSRRFVAAISTAQCRCPDHPQRKSVGTTGTKGRQPNAN